MNGQNCEKIVLQMDLLPYEKRKKCISFSDAMLAMEGLVPSIEIRDNLVAWSNGEASFAKGYYAVLKKYNLKKAYDNAL